MTSERMCATCEWHVTTSEGPLCMRLSCVHERRPRRRLGCIHDKPVGYRTPEDGLPEVDRRDDGR